MSHNGTQITSGDEEHRSQLCIKQTWFVPDLFAFFHKKQHDANAGVCNLSGFPYIFKVVTS